MKFKSFALFTSLLAGAVVVGSAPAQAFDAFSFTTNSTYKVGGEKNDIMLNSVTHDGKTVTQFNTVNNAKMGQQKQTVDQKGLVAGRLSTDCGDNVANCQASELPTNSQIIETLGNLNLNKIIDTEENMGSATLDVFFTQASDTFYLFERGGELKSTAAAGNSDLTVQGLDAKGNLVGQAFTIGKSMWTNAGYAINTREVESAQKVGSFGLSSKNGAFAGLRLITNSSGADFKVVAATTKVPEPATLVGFAIVGGAMSMVRRRKAAH